MIITLCIDKNYIDYARISIATYRHHNPEARIVVCSEEPMPKDIGYDENVIIKLPRKFRTRGKDDRISNTAYMKLFLTKLPYEKILYVDADTICMKKLDKLWNMGCRYINLCESHSYGKKQAADLGIEKYGLTGMMLMNLNALRRINFTDKCLEVETRYPTPKTGWQHDETCINVAMKDRLNFIHKKWDYCHNRKYDNPISEDKAYILHYVGIDKLKMIKGERYSSMWPVAKHIYGKKIAIVGNAKSLFEERFGHEIDENDFIIRFNKGFVTRPKFQGTRTDLLILALTLTKEEIESYNAKFVANRSRYYQNETKLMIPDRERGRIAEYIGSQPSTGFIAIDMCMYFGAGEINLYGFDFEETPTFYNPKNYKTQHDYQTEKEIVQAYEKEAILKIHKKSA